jgi:hypothetical protein
MLTASEEPNMPTETETKTSWKDKLIGLFKANASPAEMSDEERRDLLGEALKRIESQFVRIMSVTGLDSGDVVYLIDPDPGGPSPLRPYQRAFTIAADGRTTFADERVPVRPSTQWVPIMAREKPSAVGTPEAVAAATDAKTKTETKSEAQQTAQPTVAASSDCGCNKHKGAGDGAGGRAMHRNAERISALISSDKTPWQEGDRAYLEGLTDDRLSAFEKPAETATPTTATQATATPTTQATATPTTPTTATPTTAQAATETKVEIDAAELATLRAMATRFQVAESARKTALVTRLKTAQSVHSEADLKSMSVEQLQKVAALLGIDEQAADVNYSVLGAAPVEDAGSFEPPKPYSLALAKRRAESTSVGA